MGNTHWRSYGWALGSVVALGMLDFAALPHLGYQACGFVFLVGVLPIAVLTELGPTLLFAVASAVTWDYFFIPPQFTFSIQATEDAFMNVTYLAVAAVTGILGSQMKRNRELLDEKEHETRRLYELEKALASAGSVEEIARIALDRLGSMAGVTGRILVANGGKISFPEGLLSGDEQEQAQWSLRNERRAGRGTNTYAGARHGYFPLAGASAPAGVLLISEHLPPAKERCVRDLNTAIGAAIEREQHRSTANRNLLLESSERLHQTVLNSVSHELRTPLTTLLGNLSRLQGRVDPASEATLRELAGSAERLNQTVTNLLDMSRVSSGALQLRREVVDLDDLLRTCLDRSAHLLQEHQLELSVSPRAVVVRGDEKLFETAVLNLIANAARHSPAGSIIRIELSSDEATGTISVRDSGPGVSDQAREQLFEPFSSGNPEGVGLGLAIVRAIAKAHGGSATFENPAQGGAEFRISLPLEILPPYLALELSS